MFFGVSIFLCFTWEGFPKILEISFEPTKMIPLWIFCGFTTAEGSSQSLSTFFGGGFREVFLHSHPVFLPFSAECPSESSTRSPLNDKQADNPQVQSITPPVTQVGFHISLSLSLYAYIYVNKEREIENIKRPIEQSF